MRGDGKLELGHETKQTRYGKYMCIGTWRAEGSGSNDDLIAWLCVATGIDNAARQNHIEIANKKFHVYASEMTERNDEFCPRALGSACISVGDAVHDARCVYDEYPLAFAGTTYTHKSV